MFLALATYAISTPIAILAGGLGVMAVLLLIPCLTLLAEALAAAGWHPSQASTTALGDDITLAVLIPAYNEALGIQQTIDGLLPQLRQQDRLIVIADNCTDDTATVARAAGATVVERSNLDLRGKGYALDFALSQLKNAPPQVVIFMDADCQAEPGSVALLANQALTSRRPVQANYLLEQPATTGLKSAISAFAVKVKNFVRPLGLSQMGAPCLLTGTGIALPWETAIAVSVASGHIVEDMKWGLDLALAGHAPTFLPTAKVISRLPSEDQAAKVQRTRWEHGHLQILTSYTPKLLWQSLRQGRVELLALALELVILPLSLLVMVWAGLAGVTGLLALTTGIGLPFQIAAIAGLALLLAIGLAWYRYGQADLSLRQMVMLPLYILWKIPLYVAFLIRPEKQWIRTQRDGAE